jgi:hypothetical protein
MNRIESVHVAPTTERKTEPGRFGAALKSAAAGMARGIAASVELAAPYVPGGTVLSGAVRAAATTLEPRGRGSVVSSGLASSAASTAAGGGEGDLLGATRALQQEGQTFNLQYLQLQENVQRESREFTALSNVMKVKHDSAKAAINNVH